MKYFTIALLIAGWTTAHAQEACANRNLYGDYSLTITGQILAGPTAGPVAGVALTHYDGQGNLTQLDHVTHNGVPPTVEWRPGTGTYTVNADCTGAAQINFTDGSPSLNLHFVLVKYGDQIRIVVSNPHTAITSEGNRSLPKIYF